MEIKRKGGALGEESPQTGAQGNPEIRIPTMKRQESATANVVNDMPK